MRSRRVRRRRSGSCSGSGLAEVAAGEPDPRFRSVTELREDEDLSRSSVVEMSAAQREARLWVSVAAPLLTGRRGLVGLDGPSGNGRPHGDAGLCPLLDELGEAEVEDAHEVRVARDPLQHDVLGLDVPVNDGLGMRGLEPVQHLTEDAADAIGFQRLPSDGALAHLVLQRPAAFHELHHEIRRVLVRAVLEQPHDAGVAQDRGGVGLALELAQQPLGHDGIPGPDLHCRRGGLLGRSPGRYRSRGSSIPPRVTRGNDAIVARGEGSGKGCGAERARPAAPGSRVRSGRVGGRCCTHAGMPV